MTKVSIESKVRGTIYGIAIGDALGAPVESFTHTKISESYGRIDSYVVASEHKWFSGEKPGFTTDDTQLSIAVLRSIITAGNLDMDEVAKEHLNALDASDKGWGKSTRASIKRLKTNHWSKSGLGGRWR